MHRRTTVRMGIKVVQRPFAPPCPSLYNTKPGDKDRSKHKITLFGCKSAPIESKTLTQSPPSKPVEIGLEMNRLKEGSRDDFADPPKPQQSPVPAMAILSEKGDGDSLKIQDNEAEEKTPSHVTFKDNLTQGFDDITNTEGREEESCPDEGEVSSTKQYQQMDSTLGDDEGTPVGNIRSQGSVKRESLAKLLAEVPPPTATVEKQFLLSDGRVVLEGTLSKAIYHHGEEIQVTVHVRNNSSKTIKRIKVFVVQHVDVCMFSNGKFKNVVAVINSKEDFPIASNQTLLKTYTLLPMKGTTKNWIALEDSYTKAGTSLASSVRASTNNPEDRNVFAIYVSYYVKVKLIVSVMGGEVSLKLPFTLIHTCGEFDPNSTLTRMVLPSPVQPKGSHSPDPDTGSIKSGDVKPEKDGT